MSKNHIADARKKVSALEAEIDRLLVDLENARAEVARMRKERQDCDPVSGFVTDDMRSAVRWAPSSAHWSGKLVEYFGPDAREGINALERQLRDALAALSKREPLSDEQIDYLHIKHTFSETGPYEIEFARAIERAHGIGGQS